MSKYINTCIQGPYYRYFLFQMARMGGDAREEGLEEVGERQEPKLLIKAHGQYNKEGDVATTNDIIENIETAVMRDPTDDNNNNDEDVFEESPKIDNPSDDFVEPMLKHAPSLSLDMTESRGKSLSLCRDKPINDKDIIKQKHKLLRS